ncbi:low molecular weight phosphatase family protein [Winogradskyella sp. UBA3174]|uniref:arsenate-mycothiol transferase ArsC n=1 Tax=Winogradskyella sp. UBA3174 TaxID=1947785 RepID=UPI0025FE6BE9|nr:protein-tyrosine-phosphatase [Winogradskyella sp. UBA3174]|tara:strand:+ start:77225 stop:77842 length:618 start_codon:yes stop_codon:yes gene_type:complete
MLYSKIKAQIDALDVNSIACERKDTLQALIDFIQLKVANKALINLNFICTHNSRRSHLSQVWAQTMAHHYTINNVFCYSGGTEATALFPIAAKTLKQTGFKIETLSNENNPVHSIKYSDNTQPIIGFSKTYDADFNPTSEFAAILTCSSADKGCPLISGAEKRIPLTYDDPKAFDNTPQQLEKYKERSLQIATELKYVFAKIRAN